MAEAQTVYLVHSGVRKRHTRALRQRRAAGTRPKFVQRLVGGKVIVRRSRPARVTERVLKENIEEFKKAQSLGLIDVKTRFGQAVDLNTMKAAAPAAPKPKPAPPADTAAADKPGAAEPKRMYPEGAGLTEDVPPPAVTQDEIPTGDEAPSKPSKKRSKRGR